MDQPVSQLAINRRRRFKLAAAVALLATLGATAWAINRAVRPTIAASDIRVAEVRRGAIANTINASGVVIPVHEELVSSPIQTHVARSTPSWASRCRPANCCCNSTTRRSAWPSTASRNSWPSRTTASSA